MLRRKIQSTGKGSFILTLPRALVLALGLKKGTDLEVTLKGRDMVLTQAQGDSSSSPKAGASTSTIQREDYE